VIAEGEGTCMVRTLWRGIACSCVFALGSVLFAQDLIIETQKEGKNFEKYKEIEGAWMDSRTPAATAKSSAPGCTDGNVCGSRKYLFSAGTPSAPTTSVNAKPAVARFIPNFDKPGHYYVYATWPRAANATPVKYIIKHAKGTETKEVSQDGWGASGISNANIWVPLGDYDFSPGEDQYVELRTDENVKPVDPRNNGQVYADAVRFSAKPIEETGTAPLPTVTPSKTGTNLPPPIVVSPAGGGSLKWYESIPDAQAVAAKENKRILLFFYSPGSERSKYFEEIFGDPTIQPILRDKYVLVRINFAEQPQVGYSLGVFKAGTINLYDAQGNPLGQISDKLSAAQLAVRLQ